MSTEAEYREVIASFRTDKTPIVIVRVKYEDVFEYHLSYQLFEGVQGVDENGSTFTTIYAPMRVSDEQANSPDALMADRKITISGVNDLIAKNEDLVPMDVTIENGVVVSIMTFLSDLDGVLSNIISVQDYYLSDTDYSADSNACSLTIVTNPTNDSSTGELATTTKFPSLRGYA